MTLPSHKKGAILYNRLEHLICRSYLNNEYYRLIILEKKNIL